MINVGVVSLGSTITYDGEIDCNWLNIKTTYHEIWYIKMIALSCKLDIIEECMQYKYKCTKILGFGLQTLMIERLGPRSSSSNIWFLLL